MPIDEAQLMYQLGQMSQKLDDAVRDVNGLGRRIDSHHACIEKKIDALNERMPDRRLPDEDADKKWNRQLVERILWFAAVLILTLIGLDPFDVLGGN